MLVQLFSAVPGDKGPIGIVVKHSPGRVPFFLTQEGPVIGVPNRINRDTSVVDLVATLDRGLSLPVPIELRVISTKTRLERSRAGCWTTHLCKTYKSTDISAQADGPTEEPEVAIYLAWKLFELRAARFVKRHHLNFVTFTPILRINRKPLSAGRLNYSHIGYRKSGLWYDRTQEKLLHHPIEEIMATGKEIVESKSSGRLASSA